MGIGKKMEEDVRLQEFVEHVLSCAFNYLTVDEDFTLEDICDDIGISKSEAMWMFVTFSGDLLTWSPLYSAIKVPSGANNTTAGKL